MPTRALDLPIARSMVGELSPHRKAPRDDRAPPRKSLRFLASGRGRTITAKERSPLTETRIVLRDADVACDLFTRREGALASVGHDLHLRAARATFTFDLAAGTLDAVIDAAAIAVVCAREGDRDAPGALSESDRRKIDAALRDDVLCARRHPEVRVRARFTREGDRVTLDGTLSIASVERPLRAEARLEGGRWCLAHTVDQRDFGIKPFSALLGALKVRRDVTVRLAIDAARLDVSV
jgi:polyisoprenoid-binding protein YceI